MFIGYVLWTWLIFPTSYIITPHQPSWIAHFKSINIKPPACLMRKRIPFEAELKPILHYRGRKTSTSWNHCTATRIFLGRSNARQHHNSVTHFLFARKFLFIQKARHPTDSDKGVNREESVATPPAIFCMLLHPSMLELGAILKNWKAKRRSKACQPKWLKSWPALFSRFRDHPKSSAHYVCNVKVTGQINLC